MKYEWRKQEKSFYLPKTEPDRITVPPYWFFTQEGKGDPNGETFAEAVGVLYALSYAIKMLPKKGISPAGYFEYTVYPLEGVWDISEEAKSRNVFEKSELIYKIMIRQPDFVTEELAFSVLEKAKKKTPDILLDKVRFERIEEGQCVQMLHVGSFDSEPASFAQMKEFCIENHLERTDLRHREIYLTDTRKTAPEKLQTVLRYFVCEKHKEAL
jgi:hypothetical protein